MTSEQPDNVPQFDDETVVKHMRTWLERAVIGLNLCPFAKAVHAKGQIHYMVTRATDRQALRDALTAEVNALLAHDPSERDTTLLIVPDMLQEFLDFNDFLKQADRLLAKSKLDGVVQIASFHPHFEFGGAQSDDVAISPIARLIRRCTCCARLASTTRCALIRRPRPFISATSRRCKS